MAAWIEKIKRPGARPSFRVKWRIKVDGKWKKAAPSEVLHSREEAERVKAAKDAELAKIATRHRSAGLPIPWDELLKRWKASRLKLGHITDTYGNEVIANMTRLATLNGWASIADITRDAVERWRDQGNAEAKGTHKPFRQLKSLLRWAASEPTLRQPVDLDVLTLEQRTQDHREPPPLLTHDQVEQVVARAYLLGQRYGALIDHLTRYGCRPIDCCRLLVSDWNPREQLLTLRETKNGDNVTHPVEADFAKTLNGLCDQRRPSEPLYLSPKGEAWHINAMGTAVELRDWYRNRIGSWILPRAQWGIYLLKDYAITTMERDGIDDRTKALFTGHRDLSCLSRYKTTNIESAKAALAKRKVGADARRSGGKSGGSSPTQGATQVANDLTTKTEKVKMASKNSENKKNKIKAITP